MAFYILTDLMRILKSGMCDCVWVRACVCACVCDQERDNLEREREDKAWSKTNRMKDREKYIKGIKMKKQHAKNQKNQF